jgi:hypothetical protein
MSARGFGLLGEPVPQPLGDASEGQTHAAYPIAGVAVTEAAHSVGLEVGCRQQGADGLLGPGGLLGGRRQLALGLRLGAVEELGSPRLGRVQHLLGLVTHRVGIGSRTVARGPGRVGGIDVQRGDLVVRRRQHLVTLGLGLRHAGLDQVARLGVLLVGPGVGRRRDRVRLLLGLAPEPLRLLVRLAQGLLGCLEPGGRRALGLGHDLVVVGLGGLHQEPGLVSRVGHDLVRVVRAVLELLLGEDPGPSGLLVVLVGLFVQAPGLLGEAPRLLLGVRLQLLGHLLGVPEQRRSLLASRRCVARAGGALLHRSHQRILPEDRPQRESARRLGRPDGR